MSTEFIKIIRLNSSEQFQVEKTVRVVIFIIDDFAPEEESFCRWLEGFEIPVILALKTRTDEKLVSAAHLCVAAEKAKIGKYSAKEALKLGLINKVVSFENIEKEAFELAEKISLRAPLAIRAFLKAVNRGMQMPLEDGLKLETELFTRIFSTADMREGTGAFLEKRKPVFEGK